jgi:undecaprenyl-phosphate alpha-N-acetylglucosaminyl 1-phosphatetransferase
VTEFVHQWLSYGVSFGITLFFLWVLTPIAIRLDLVDHPGGRKQHTGTVPLIGGIAMFLGFAFSLLTLDISLAPYRGFIAAATLLVVVGVLDDLHELSPRARLAAQFIASVMMVWSGVYLQNIGNLFGGGLVSFGFLAIPFTILATVAAINAVNMIDGIDGLAGGLSVIELLMISILLQASHHVFAISLLGILIAAVCAFLCFNFPFGKMRRATIFMGDSGSMFLGFTMTWLLIQFSQQPDKSFDPIIILWILAVPVFDLITVTFRRLLSRVSPFKAQRDHIHHVLEATGMSIFHCSLSICGFALLLGSLGVAGSLWKVPDSFMLLGLLVLYALYVGIYIQLQQRRTLQS